MGARRLYIYSWEIIVLPVLKTKVGVAQNGTIAEELPLVVRSTRICTVYVPGTITADHSKQGLLSTQKTYLVPGIYLPIFTNNIRSSYLVFTMVPRNTVKAVLSVYCAGSDQVHRPVYICLPERYTPEQRSLSGGSCDISPRHAIPPHHAITSPPGAAAPVSWGRIMF